MPRRRIVIPKGIKCTDCGSTNLIGRGTDWRNNPNGSKPPRILVQLFRCKDCGKIFADGEVQNKTEAQ